MPDNPLDLPEPSAARKRTIQFRLMVGIVAVVLVLNSILAVLTVLHVGGVLLDEVQTRVRLDLNAAHQVYDSSINNIYQFLKAVSLHPGIAAALRQGDHAAMAEILAGVQQQRPIDILSLLDRDGRVLYRTSNPGLAGDDLSGISLVHHVIREHQGASGTIIIPKQTLENEGEELEKRAYFEIQETPAARPNPEKMQTDAMAMAAAVPVVDAHGEILGVLYAAELLCRQYETVDAIKDVVFQNETYQGKDIGTATIFRRDIRISTNVKNRDGSRAIGTRMSAQVYNQVIDQGKMWADRAFVVNDWYITAYDPIRDPDDHIVGALYVGLLEAPFARTQLVTVGGFLGMVAVTTGLSLMLLFLVLKLILRPISRIISMSNKVVAGDLSARVGIKPSGEMGLLCTAVDAMADAVAKREADLERATRQQIGQSEKLASIGRLAAGIAHEINNPLTGVLTFAHLLRAKPNMEEQDRQDLDVVVRETTRVREIVRGLLDFARESPSIKQMLDINDVIRQTMKLVRSQKEFGKIVLVEDLAGGLPPVHGDKNQLQQVFLNLSLNACEAMPGGGTLSITSFLKDGHVRIAVSDTGCGIKKEHLEKIFEPFFTTKPIGKGTGLGLSVSYGIVHQHGGALEVESEEGKGSCFTVVLPVQAETLADGRMGA